MVLNLQLAHRLSDKPTLETSCCFSSLYWEELGGGTSGARNQTVFLVQFSWLLTNVVSTLPPPINSISHLQNVDARLQGREMDAYILSFFITGQGVEKGE